ncbi:GNAT family N-acetyltransferase [Microlunatus sp. Gsoil 973]|uniref:GNAT family N-acetyltransferase n=1 Tax=Microlunatus sp. Gsoil 973 TaxID=2672569 RepID=UPI0012B4C226|nr:GNAT family N-acetyltransferase [Microlunatus sp. Gsoil 973]QGN32118.1 GNAT family N-acetyltransferase [Microlunatus sp. Gsoil 973]
MTSTNRTEMIIRDRQDEDLDSIVTLALESLTWHADTFPHVRRPPARDGLASDFQALTPEPDTYFRVAVLDTTVTGFLTATIQPPNPNGIEALDEPTLYIADVIVTQAARRRGICQRRSNFDPFSSVEN